ncbi:MAG: antibiotic biosynthesis monooxygenase family protein, partial [Geminicoccaceae bacterium]
RMLELVETYDGYLGIEAARNTDGTGVAVSYWKDIETIQKWAKDPEHQVAKKMGRSVWYDYYMIRIAKIERVYGRSGS